MLSVAEDAKVVRVANRLVRTGAHAQQIKDGEGHRERFWVAPRHLMLPPDMAWMIRFMVNSFVRPADIRQLRHKHVQIVRGEHVYLRLSLPENKRHDMPMVTLRPSVAVYERLLTRSQGMGLGAPEDCVFLPAEKDRTCALAVLGFWFKWVLREAGMPPVDSF